MLVLTLRDLAVDLGANARCGLCHQTLSAPCIAWRLNGLQEPVLHFGLCLSCAAVMSLTTLAEIHLLTQHGYSFQVKPYSD